MGWPDTIAEGLPEPRDDEPADLRQDIVDELADHLQLAMNRQRHTAQDEGEAARRVVERFGDPRRVARRLWLDEMKGRIMSKRLTIVMSSVMAAACLAAFVILWLAVNQSRAVNLAILDKLETLTEQPAAPSLAEYEWGQFKIRLVTDKPGGPPAVDMKFSLAGQLYSHGEHSVLTDQQVPTVNGLVDFGFVRVGTYRLQIETPWGERLHETLTVKPLASGVREVVCPGAPPPESRVRFSLDMPDELRKQSYWFAIAVNGHGSRKIGEAVWRWDHNKMLYLNTEGDVMSVQDGRSELGDEWEEWGRGLGESGESIYASQDATFSARAGTRLQITSMIAYRVVQEGELNSFIPSRESPKFQRDYAAGRILFATVDADGPNHISIPVPEELVGRLLNRDGEGDGQPAQSETAGESG